MAVRFVQEMGDGVFGKVYRGELGGIVGGSSTLVAVKTLKIGANQATRGDFQRDSELMADLRHPNIVCLLGVVLKDEPQCLIFEYMPQGDLHEYLLVHSPKSQEMPLSLTMGTWHTLLSRWQQAWSTSPATTMCTATSPP